MEKFKKPKVFYGGQIKKAYGGDKCVVVNGVDKQTGRIGGSFYHDFGSKEFRHVTGVYVAQNEVVRVYMGVNDEIALEIVKRTNGTTPEEADLKGLDRMIVLSWFLNENNFLKEK